MNRIEKQLKPLLLSLAVSLSLTACGQTAGDLKIAPLETTAPSVTDTSAGEEEETETAVSDSEQDSGDSVSSNYYSASHSGRYRFRNDIHYTKADYDLALSFLTDGYQDKTVEEFDKSVMNWSDEEAWHKMEDALKRLYSGLSRDDENADFIFGTLGNTWDACEKKHYDTCEREKNAWHNGYAVYETFGDVYGDQLRLTGAYADFDFDYLIPDGNAITVGERDAILDSVQEKLTAYMKGQPKEKLRDEDAMEKTLKTELEKQLKTLGEALTWGGGCGLSYWWEAPWETEWDEAEKDTGRKEEKAALPQTYTKEEYEYVLDKLKFDRHKDMPVSEFDRLVNALFTSSDEAEWEKFQLAYEAVSAYIEEEDPNFTFFRDTVNRAMDEYEAQARTVFSGRQCDPAYRDRLSMERSEDVFGDQITVEILECEYTLTYRITDADTLTVGQRDRFFEDVKAGVKDSLEAAVKNGEVSESDFKKLLLDAGKKAGNSMIMLTGCEVEYLYHQEG